MHQSKLFSLLRGLQPEEIHWLQKFINSPFYNTNSLHNDLFNYIKKYYPDLDAKKLSKEAACKKLFPDEPFNYQKLRKAMHGLTNLTEEFLIATRLRKNNFEKKKILIAELGERNIYGQFEKGTKELIGELEALPYRDTFYYKNMHELNLKYYGHVETSRQNLGLRILSPISKNFNFYYLLQRQQLNCAIMAHEKLFTSKLPKNPLGQAEIEAEKEPVFKLYNLVYEAMTTSDNAAIYLEIEFLFRENIGRLGNEDKLSIFRFLLNHLGGQINKGIDGVNSILFSLYKFGLEQNIIIEKGQITGSAFSNIATVGILEKEFDWVENFIKNYSQYLPTSDRIDATHLSKATLYFHKKEYSNVIGLISNNVFNKPLYVVQSKTILIRSYFEYFVIDSSYFDLLIAQSQAFEKFIRRNEMISNDKKEMHLNFILFTKKIANEMLQNTMDRQLIKKIKKTKSVILKSWLIEKLEQFMKKNKRHTS